MSGITDPSEEYFKDGLWAWVSNQWKKLVADASSFLQINIAAQDVDVEVKQTTAADLTPGVKGWDGTQWRKLPLIWGYSGLAGEDLANTNLGAGSNTLDGTPVPSGEVHVVQQAAIRYTGTVPTSFHITTKGTPGTPVVFQVLGPTSGLWYPASFFAILAAGDYMGAGVAGATAGDNLHFEYSGYKMKVAE